MVVLPILSASDALKRILTNAYCGETPMFLLPAGLFCGETFEFSFVAKNAEYVRINCAQ